ncbi:aquaporin-like protein [Crepidotus variabilis]|uniref:Aquaporin-like protein n=1 Tax=Crepidotus variabilis TaxID=179855 RepID=A0A9P6E946_9AGAR|nr:aquaporin-like protein [Crepidotus variabilis]
MSTRPVENPELEEELTFRERLLLDIRAASVEFFGTATFLLLGLGGIQAGSITDGSTLERTMYFATSFGLSLLVSAWLFYRVTGGLFNPNVSLALCLVRVITPMRFVLYCIAQLAGGIAGAALVRALTPEPYSVNVFLKNHINKAQGVFIEMFITAALVLAVLMLAAEKHEATPFAPIGIGLTLFAGHLFALAYTGAAMNTARAFGPAVVSGFPHSDHWVYWLGPFVGSLLGVAVYTFLKHYRYWTINPGQTAMNPRHSPADPVDTLKATLNRSGNGDTRRSGSLTGHRTSADYRRETNGGLEKRHLNDTAV